MDNQKQIEEMAKDLQEAWLAWSKSAEMANAYDFVAKILAKKWQPKIPENAVVLTREEYNRLLGQYKNLEIKYNCVWEDFRRYEIENEILKQNIVVLRKDTVEKFAEMAKEEAFTVFMGEPIIRASKIDEICKEITEGKDGRY